MTRTPRLGLIGRLRTWKSALGNRNAAGTGAAADTGSDASAVRTKRRKTTVLVAALAVGALAITGITGAVVASERSALASGDPVGQVDPRAIGPDSPVMAPVDDEVKSTFEGTQDLIIETTAGQTGALVAALEALGITPTQQFGTALDGVAVTVTQAQLAAIQASLTTVIISVDHASVLYDSRTQDQAPWNVDRTDQLDYTPTAGTRSFTYPSSAGQGATVFVIDTGFTRTNSELDGRVNAGKDFAGGDHGTPDDTSDDRSSRDCNGHGTHVAGTVASTTYGVAKLATIVPVRVFTCSGSTTTSVVIAGIDWAVANRPAQGSAVISMSLGTTGGSAPVDRAVQNAINAGMTVVVAAGNGGADAIGDDACFGSTNSEGNYENGTSPARVIDAITVGATGYANGSSAPSGSQQDIEAYFSNYGTCVDMFAPGWNILSLRHDSPNPRVMSGTSMATPLVAGAVALYLGENPNASPAAVRAALSASAAKDKITYAKDYWPRYISNFPTERATHTPNLLVNTLFLMAASERANAPQSVSSTSSTVDSVSLAWTAPRALNGNAITDYYVQSRQNESSEWVTAERAPSRNTGSTVTGLPAGNQFEFRVAAVTAKGNGVFSETLLAKTLTGLPSEPVSLVTGETTRTSVSLNWTAPTNLNGGVLIDYTVQYRANAAAPWLTFDHTPTTATGITVTGVGGLTGNQFQVAARTVQGNGAFAGPVNRTPSSGTSVGSLSGVPSAPENLLAIAASGSDVVLEWSAASAANGSRIIDYVVQYRVIGAMVWETFAQPAKASTGQTVTGLNASTRYQFQVTAYTSSGGSSASATTEASTSVSLTPLTPLRTLTGR
jgi:subtilisin family serine protease